MIKTLIQVAVTLATFTFPAFAQHTTLDEEMAKQICECLTKGQTQADFSKFEPCQRETIGKYQNKLEEIAAASKKDSLLTEYENGRKFGMELSLRLQQIMISNCDPFFLTMDSLILSPFKSTNIAETKNKLVIADSLVRQQESARTLYLRTVAYATLGEFDKAHKDINRMLEMDKTFIGAHGIRGIVYQLQGDYPAAKKEFEIAIENSDIPQLRLMLAIVERKIAKR